MERKKQESIIKEFIIPFGKKVMEERLKHKLNIPDLSIKSNVSRSVIYNLEFGLSDNITLKSIIGLAMALDIKEINISVSLSPLLV